MISFYSINSLLTCFTDLDSCLLSPYTDMIRRQQPQAQQPSPPPPLVATSPDVLSGPQITFGSGDQAQTLAVVCMLHEYNSR